jgi:predicted ABC-type ATPase
MPLALSPVIYVIGGPNGAGKTTFAREFLPAAEIGEFLNADLLAAGLAPLQPAAMALRAARLLLARWRELVAARTSFA